MSSHLESHMNGSAQPHKISSQTQNSDEILWDNTVLAKFSLESLNELPVHRLHDILRIRGIPSQDCVEKHDLAQRVRYFLPHSIRASSSLRAFECFVMPLLFCTLYAIPSCRFLSGHGILAQLHPPFSMGLYLLLCPSRVCCGCVGFCWLHCHPGQVLSLRQDVCLSFSLPCSAE